MRPRIATVILLLTLVRPGAAEDQARARLQDRFTSEVQPFLNTYCIACHGPEKQKGKLDLSLFHNLDDVIRDYRRWDTLRQKLREAEMPPEEAPHLPTHEQRQAIIEWITALRDNEARHNAGDPGVVLARRLSNAEFDYSIRGQGENSALDRFCDVFPDSFFIYSRPSYENPNATDGVRLLSAGFHLMHGYFRDDAPLCDLVLDDVERRELDRLWVELDFITRSPSRQYKDFIFFERAEPPRFMIGAQFDFARSEDKEATSAAKMDQLEELYLKRAREIGANDTALEAIEHYFHDMSATLRRMESLGAAAEPRHLESLRAFAEQAWRRPLAEGEEADLLGFYRALTSGLRIIPRLTTTGPTPTSASRATTAASSPTWPDGLTRCRRAKAPCSIIPASCSSPTCGPAAVTTRPRCRCSWPADWVAPWKQVACWTTADRGMTSASSAASTSRSWTAWA